MSSIQFKDEDERERFTLNKEGEWEPIPEKRTINERINPGDYED